MRLALVALGAAAGLLAGLTQRAVEVCTYQSPGDQDPTCLDGLRVSVLGYQATRPLAVILWLLIGTAVGALLTIPTRR